MNPALYLTVGLPTLIQGYVVGCFALLFRVIKKPGFDGPVLYGEWAPWIAKRWSYTTTIGAFQGRASWFDERTRVHEAIHLEQYMNLNMLGAVLAACLVPALGWWSFLVWGTSGAPWILPNFLTAIINYKRPGVSWLQAAYYQSSHERHAYAETKTFFDNMRDRWE